MRRKYIFSVVAKNDINYVEQSILEPDFNINEQDDIGFTILHIAVSKGNVELVKFLAFKEC